MRLGYNTRMLTRSRRLAVALLALLPLLYAVPVRAVLLKDVHSAQLPIADRSAAALATARREGLAQVVVKLTGSSDSLAAPAVQEALAQAQRYLVQYGYVEGEGEGEGEALQLRLEYDGDLLQGLLEEAGLPLWTANRPTVLAWLVLSDGRQRRFAASEELPELRAALRDAFARRGVPLQQPLYDLEDRRKLTAGEAWRQSSVALMAASSRYRDRELLSGRAALLSDGSYLGDWRYLDGGRWVLRSVAAASLDEFLDAGADLVATQLAARYAVVARDGGDERYLLSVTGVRDFRAYRGLVDLLAALETVRRVVPESIERERVRLRVTADARPEQLARLLALDARLVPTAAPPGATDGLYYDWRE
jgi:hypothetical protein